MRCKQKRCFNSLFKGATLQRQQGNAWKILCANDINKGMSIIRQSKTKARLDYDVIHDDIPASCRKKLYNSQKLGYPRYYCPVKKTMLYLHNLVLGKKKGYQVDHTNRNRQDVTRANLRYMLPQQNIWNQGMNGKNTTGYKGVVKTRHGRFLAQVKVKGKVKNLGTYALAISAHEAYQRHCKAKRGSLIGNPNEEGIFRYTISWQHGHLLVSNVSWPAALSSDPASGLS